MNQFVPIDFIRERRIVIQWKWTIECINPKQVSEEEINQLWILEQDMWAHGLQEYVRCLECWNIDGKHDIYPEEIYGVDVIRKTVFEIERILWMEICCTKCWWETEHIFSEAYKEDIATRYQFPASFLCVFRDTVWIIQWFMDWYISTFENIYEREFSHYYCNVWKDKIKTKVEEVLWVNTPDELLCIPALGVSETSASMFIIYSLMRIFFQEVFSYNPEIIWIYESALWTNTHGIYSACWAQRIGALVDDIKLENIHDWMESDIFVHPHIAIDFLREFWKSLKYFLKKNWAHIKEIVELHS